MLTLVKYQISKRIRYSVGIIIGFVLLNAFFTGIIEICVNNGKNPYEGYNVAFKISIGIIILLHILSIKNDFYDDRGKMLFSFPLRGHVIVFSRLIILLMDVVLATFLNLFISFFVRIVAVHNLKAPVKFLNIPLGAISSGSILIISAIIMIFLFVYFAITLSETLFYQNGVVGLISTIVIFFLYSVIMKCSSFLLNLLVSFKLPIENHYLGDADFVIPVIRNSYYNITNIFLVIVFIIISFIGTSKIIDKHLNL